MSAFPGNSGPTPVRPRGDAHRRALRIAAVVAELVVERGEHPWDINCGGCATFADALARRLRAAGLGPFRTVYGEDLGEPWAGHVWATDGERCYDAEEPYGVTRHELLPIFLRKAAGSRYAHLRRAPRRATLKPSAEPAGQPRQ